MMSNITSMADKMEQRKMGVIHPRDIKMGGRKYYKYMGSLTVPPCTEGVTWIINKKVSTLFPFLLYPPLFLILHPKKISNFGW